MMRHNQIARRLNKRGATVMDYADKPLSVVDGLVYKAGVQFGRAVAIAERSASDTPYGGSYRHDDTFMSAVRDVEDAFSDLESALRAFAKTRM